MNKELYNDHYLNHTVLKHNFRVIDYPADKKEVSRIIRDGGNIDPKIADFFEKLREREYSDTLDVTTEFDLIKIAMNFKFKLHPFTGPHEYRPLYF